MRRIFSALLFLSMATAGGALAAEQHLESESARINYSVGYQIGGDFKKQGVEIDAEALVRGIKDATKGTPALSSEEMNKVLVDLKKKIVAGEKAQAKPSSAGMRKAGKTLLAENAKREGVKVLPSGVQYRVLTAGTGRKPTIKDTVTVNFRITRPDGKEIANTYTGGKPRTEHLEKAIPGLREVLPLMGEGSKWEVLIPPSAASAGREPVDEMGVLIYDLELVSVQTATS